MLEHDIGDALQGHTVEEGSSRKRSSVSGRHQENRTVSYLGPLDVTLRRPSASRPSLLQRGPAWDATGSDWNQSMIVLAKHARTHEKWIWTGPGTGPGTLVLPFQITCQPRPVLGPVLGLDQSRTVGPGTGPRTGPGTVLGSVLGLVPDRTAFRTEAGPGMESCRLKPLQTPFHTGTRVSEHCARLGPACPGPCRRPVQGNFGRASFRALPGQLEVTWAQAGPSGN